MAENILIKNSMIISSKVVTLYPTIKNEIVANKLLDAVTDLGMYIKLSYYDLAKSEYLKDLNSALREAGKTEYFLRLVFMSRLMTKTDYQELFNLVIEIKNTITTQLKSLKK